MLLVIDFKADFCVLSPQRDVMQMAQIRRKNVPATWTLRKKKRRNAVRSAAALRDM